MLEVLVGKAVFDELYDCAIFAYAADELWISILRGRKIRVTFGMCRRTGAKSGWSGLLSLCSLRA